MFRTWRDPSLHALILIEPKADERSSSYLASWSSPTFLIMLSQLVDLLFETLSSGQQRMPLVLPPSISQAPSPSVRRNISSSSSNNRRSCASAVERLLIVTNLLLSHVRCSHTRSVVERMCVLATSTQGLACVLSLGDCTLSRPVWSTGACCGVR